MAHSCDAQKKAERKKLAIAQTVFRSDRFFPPLLGANQRGPFAQMFDRFAMTFTTTRMRAFGLRAAALVRNKQTTTWSGRQIEDTLALANFKKGDGNGDSEEGE